MEDEKDFHMEGVCGFSNRIRNKDDFESAFPGPFKIVLTFIPRRPEARTNAENILLGLF